MLERTDGTAIAAKIMPTATTITSSISVNPRSRRRFRVGDGLHALACICEFFIPQISLAVHSLHSGQTHFFHATEITNQDVAAQLYRGTVCAQSQTHCLKVLVGQRTKVLSQIIGGLQ